MDGTCPGPDAAQVEEEMATPIGKDCNEGLRAGMPWRLPSPADGVVGCRRKSPPFRLRKWTDGSVGCKTSDPAMKTHKEMEIQVIVIQWLFFTNEQTGHSYGLLSHRFLRARWGEDVDTAYARAHDGKLHRIDFGADGERVAEFALTGPGAVPADEKPRVVSPPAPWAPFFLVRSSTGDKRLWRCDPERDPKEGAPAASCRVVSDYERNAVQWLNSADGRVAARIVLSEAGERILQTLPRSGKRRTLFSSRDYYAGFEPIGPVQADNRLWALSGRDRDRVALVRLDLGTGEEETFFEHDRFDVESAAVHFDREGRARPLLAVANPDYQQIVHFDGRLKAAYEALLDKLGRPTRIDFRSMDLAGRYATVAARNPRIHRG